MRALVAIVGVLCVLVPGCGSSGPPPTPAACLAGEEALLSALRDAPSPVRLAGTTAISGCLTDEQEAAQIANVGSAMIAAGTQLNAKARRGDAAAALQAGYLLGAVTRGATDTGGIHEDLVRRLGTAVRFDGGTPLPAAIRGAIAKGYAAGRKDG